MYVVALMYLSLMRASRECVVVCLPTYVENTVAETITSGKIYHQRGFLS